jgi:hypothetical protein
MLSNDGTVKNAAPPQAKNWKGYGYHTTALMASKFHGTISIFPSSFTISMLTLILKEIEKSRHQTKTRGDCIENAGGIESLHSGNLLIGINGYGNKQPHVHKNLALKRLPLRQAPSMY